MSKSEISLFFTARQRRHAALLEIVTKIGTQAPDAFKSNDELLTFSKALTQQLQMSGVAGQQLTGMTTQLVQALGSGVLRGDERGSVFEASPQLVGRIADYMKVPVGGIRDLAKEGKISAETVKNALLSSAGKIDAEAQNMPKT